MDIPVYDSVENAIMAIFGGTVTVSGRRPVSGGDINDASLISLSNGKKVFVKSNSASREAFFIAEADGLNAIAETGTIATPRLLCRGRDDRMKRSFLIMEYIEGGSRISDFWEVFADELYRMHSADLSGIESRMDGGRYGFFSDNFIGAGEQINSPRDSWISFFRDCRLKPQFERASRYLSPGDRKKIGRLLDGLDGLLVEPEHPSFLHGDLWGGNFVTGNDGKAWLIDPATYVGHAEADLAMTELFGGFSGRFYEEYRNVSKLDPGYGDRRDLYNLYHLTNHLNLFGGSYYSSVMRIVNRYAGVN